MDLAEAQVEVERKLAERYGDQNFEVAILEDETIERKWGWVFFFQSEEFLKKRNLKHGLAGLGALTVDRQTGLVGGLPHTSDGRRYSSIEPRIREYERSLLGKFDPVDWSLSTDAVTDYELSASFDLESY